MFARHSSVEARIPLDSRLSDGLASRRLFTPVLLGLGLTAVLFAVLNGLVASLGQSPQFSFTLAGSFVLYLATKPAPRELVATVGLGLVLRVVYGATFGVNPYFGSLVISTAGFLGVAGLVSLACSAVRLRRVSEFGVAAYFPFVSILVGFILPVTNHFSPYTFDLELLGCDGATGFQPSFFLGRLIHGRPAVWDITATIYYALPLAVALLCAARVGQRRGEVGRLLWLFGLMSVVGFCLYAVCPATGPIYAFREWFPSGAPDVSRLSLAHLPAPAAPRNAIPSLHFSTALLVFWNTHFLRRERWAAGLFLAGTGFAVLALGEHYLTDVVVAVPFSLFFHAAFSDTESAGSVWRSAAMFGGAGFVAVWLLILRFGSQQLPAHPALTCLAFAATVGMSVWIQAKLARSRI